MIRDLDSKHPALLIVLLLGIAIVGTTVLGMTKTLSGPPAARPSANAEPSASPAATPLQADPVVEPAPRQVPTGTRVLRATTGTVLVRLHGITIS